MREIDHNQIVHRYFRDKTRSLPVDDLRFLSFPDIRVSFPNTWLSVIILYLHLPTNQKISENIWSFWKINKCVFHQIRNLYCNIKPQIKVVIPFVGLRCRFLIFWRAVLWTLCISISYWCLSSRYILMSSFILLWNMMSVRMTLSGYTCTAWCVLSKVFMLTYMLSWYREIKV